MVISNSIRLFLCFIIVIGSLIVGLTIPSHVYAIDPPENGGGIGSIERSRVFQNIFEQGDWLFISLYNLEYTVEPGIPASLAYTFSITTDAGVAIVSNPLNDYYQANIVAIYLTRKNAVAYGFGTDSNPWSTWGDNYKAVIQGNATSFTGTPPAVDDSLSGDYSPNSSSDYPLYGTELTDEMNDSRILLDSWLLSTVKKMEDILGEELITHVGGRDYINRTGSAYVVDAIPGIQELTQAFSLREYVPSYTATIDTFAYQQELRGDITINFCEETDYWDTDAPAELSLYSPDRIQGDYSIKVYNDAPNAFQTYETIYDPDDDIDIGSRTLTFWWLCDKPSTYFNSSRVYVYDTSGQYYAWDFTFQEDIASSHGSNLANPTYYSGTVSLTSVDYIVWALATPSSATLDPTGFTYKIDNVHAKGVPGMGIFTQEAFDGIGEWLGVSGTFVGGLFFFIIYLIAASIIYLTTSNHIAALAICIPVILFAILLGVIPMTFMALIVFLLIVGMAYFVWIRGA